MHDLPAYKLQYVHTLNVNIQLLDIKSTYVLKRVFNTHSSSTNAGGESVSGFDTSMWL